MPIKPHGPGISIADLYRSAKKAIATIEKKVETVEKKVAQEASKVVQKEVAREQQQARQFHDVFEKAVNTRVSIDPRVGVRVDPGVHVDHQGGELNIHLHAPSADVQVPHLVFTPPTSGSGGSGHHGR